MKCYYQQSVLYEVMGNESKAFLYLKLYNIINDSIRSQAYTQQIAEMQTKYESEKKEIEITKLNAEKQLRVAKIARTRILNYSLFSIAGLILISGSVLFRNVQKKRIAEKHVAILEKQNAIESMRSKIASDVHDEMGANLTRLGLNAQQLLQSHAVPQNEKILAEKMAMQSQEILTGMREIIWASNPANDNLKSMLGFMRQYIDRFFDGTQIRSVVNFPQDIGEVTLHPEVRRNLFLILKESLNNALKYSGSDRIDIDFQSENDQYQFTVKDYGKGLDEKNKNDFSNGLLNMQMRAEQIKSLFRLITAPGEGVQISVEGRLY
jgi:signal transduction histidine kinase